MTPLSTVESIETQVLDALTQAQDLAIQAVSSVTSVVEPVVPDLPVPFADQLPTAAELVDSAYGFAEAILKNQHQFASKLVDAVAPLLGSRAAKPKTPAKPKAVASEAKTA